MSTSRLKLPITLSNNCEAKEGKKIETVKNTSNSFFEWPAHQNTAYFFKDFEIPIPYLFYLLILSADFNWIKKNGLLESCLDLTICF